MLLNQSSVTNAISNVAQRGMFTIAASGKAFRTLFETLYQDKIGSIVREVSCNAYDSHLEAGKSDVPFEIHLPSNMEPYFSVKDFGVGMDEMMVEDVFTSLFTSTKDTSNTSVGAFGLGSKTPFAYTDIFTVIAIKNGISRTFSMYLSTDGVPQYAKLSETETTEHNGVEVILPVNSVNDRRAFINSIVNQLHFFPVRPTIKGGDYGLTWMTEPTGLYSEYNGIKFFNSGEGMSGCYAVVGPVGYKLNFDILKEHLPSHKKIIDWLQNRVIRIHFNIGDVSVTPSRETLSYDSRTLKAFDNKLTGLVETLTKTYREQFQALPSLIEKALYIHTQNDWAKNLVDRSLYTVFDNTIFQSVAGGTNFNRIIGERIAKMVGCNTEICFGDFALHKSRINLKAELFTFIGKNLSFCIIDTNRLIHRRMQTFNSIVGPVHSAVGFKQPSGRIYGPSVKTLLESYGIKAYLLSEFEPCKIDSNNASYYRGLKAHGYKLVPECIINISDALSGSSHWEKLVSKTDIEPGFFVKSHYGEIDSPKYIEKIQQLRALKLLADDEVDGIDIYAFPIKACEKLSADDGWIDLYEYVQTLSTKVNDTCHKNWIAIAMTRLMARADTRFCYKMMTADFNLASSISDFTMFLDEQQATLDACDSEMKSIMTTIIPSIYTETAVGVLNEFVIFATAKLEKLKLIYLARSSLSGSSHHPEKLMGECQEYVRYVSENYPERFNDKRFTYDFVTPFSKLLS